MTAPEMSDQLAALGISYSANSVRKAWQKNAPRTDAKAFAMWLASSSSYTTEARDQAFRATGLRITKSEDGELLTTQSAAETASLICGLVYRHDGFWLPLQVLAWTLMGQTVALSIDDPTESRRVDELIGEEFVTAACNAAMSLNKLMSLATQADEKLAAAGHSADSHPWSRYTDTPEGVSDLWERWKQAHTYAFSRIKDDPKPKKKAKR